MKQKHKFVVGSRAFFDGMEGFNPKDTDLLYVMEDWDMPERRFLIARKDGFDRIFQKEMSKQEIIKLLEQGGTRLKVGQLLVPEFAAHIGLTVQDLECLVPMIDRLGERHAYYGVILRSYMENGSFTLTDDQRREAFEAYNRARPAQTES